VIANILTQARQRGNARRAISLAFAISEAIRRFGGNPTKEIRANRSLPQK
jgi:hypothetical protein